MLALQCFAFIPSNFSFPSGILFGLVRLVIATFARCTDITSGLLFSQHHSLFQHLLPRSDATRQAIVSPLSPFWFHLISSHPFLHSRFKQRAGRHP